MYKKNIIYFSYELSWILIPLFVYLYLFINKSKSILLYSLNVIAIIGIWDTILKKKYVINLNFGYLQFYTALFCHAVLFLSLFDFMKYGYPNLKSYLLLIIGSIIIYYLPWWPYMLTKKTTIFLAITIYIILTILYLLIKTFKFKEY